MIPTRSGRIQTRIFLSLVIGVPVTIIFALVLKTYLPFAYLSVAIIIGLCFEFISHEFQHFSWDQDWPPLFIIVFSLLEYLMLLLINLTARIILPDLSFGFVPLKIVSLHFLSIWIVSYVALVQGLNILFPKRRFAGGKIIISKDDF